MTQIVLEGAMLILAERERQQWSEGWSVEHDDLHTEFQLSKAALSYLFPYDADLVKRYWPWEWKFWKPARSTNLHDQYLSYHIKDLVKAGALIAAEIDRLQRLKLK